jgi:hypothetical protein
MYEDHLKTCRYCQKNDRAAKLGELGRMIKATSAGPGTGPRTKGASDITKFKLKELGKMIKGL